MIDVCKNKRDLRAQLRAQKRIKGLSFRVLAGAELGAGHLSDFIRGRCDVSVTKLERMLEAHGMRLLIVDIEPQ